MPEIEGLVIPEVHFKLTEEHYRRLQHEVDCFSSSENYAADLYGVHTHATAVCY